MRRIGFALMVLGPTIFAVWLFWPYPSTTIPINQKISLSQASELKYQFQAELTWLHVIELDLEPSGRCKLATCRLPSDIRIDWSVTSEGRKISFGSDMSLQKPSPSSDGTYISEIGRFKAIQGRAYEIAVNVHHVGVAGDYSPSLVVAVFPSYSEQESFTTMLLLAGMLLCMALGLALVRGGRQGGP